jgi:hypothetical protein
VLVVGPVHDNVDCAFAVAVYVNALGAAAAPFGMVYTVEEFPIPAALTALTRNQYAMLFVSPVTTNGLVALLLFAIV